MWTRCITVRMTSDRTTEHGVQETTNHTLAWSNLPDTTLNGYDDIVPLRPLYRNNQNNVHMCPKEKNNRHRIMSSAGSLHTSWYLQLSAVIYEAKRRLHFIDKTAKVNASYYYYVENLLPSGRQSYSSFSSRRARRKAGPRLPSKSLPCFHQQGFVVAKFSRSESNRLCCLGCNKHATKPNNILELKDAKQITWNDLHWDYSEVCSNWAFENICRLA